jgi:cyclopropane fatty-acyl-phospholipid synthase-like methyltransferase
MSNWEHFANENAEYYILTVDGIDYSTEEGKKYFFGSGAKFFSSTIEHIEERLKEKEHALEIGCGIGRLTIPHARFFNKVSAVDISPTMLSKLKHIAEQNGIENIQCYLPHEKWDDFAYDYAYSFIVFQHIPDIRIIENYIGRIARSLKKGGIVQLQFDTRAQSFLYIIRNMTPDFLLPKSQRKGIRRIRRSSQQLKSIFEQNKLTILKEFNPNTEMHTFILKK